MKAFHTIKPSIGTVIPMDSVNSMSKGVEYLFPEQVQQERNGQFRSITLEVSGLKFGSKVRSEGK